MAQGRLWIQSPALLQAVPSLGHHLVSISGAAERVKKDGACGGRCSAHKDSTSTCGTNVRGQWGHACACGSVWKTFQSGCVCLWVVRVCVCDSLNGEYRCVFRDDCSGLGVSTGTLTRPSVCCVRPECVPLWCVFSVCSQGARTTTCASGHTFSVCLPM